MKSKVLAILFVVIGFEILDATDTDLLKEFMNSNLSPPPQPVITEPDVPAPPAPPPCPGEVNVAWQLRPPYTMERNESDRQPSIDGIFHQALDFALEKCCVFFGGRKPISRYLNVSSNSSELLRHAFNESISLVLPLNEDQRNIIGYSRAYVNIIDSPGVVLIQRNPSYSIEKGEHCFKLYGELGLLWS